MSKLMYPDFAIGFILRISILIAQLQDPKSSVR